MVELPLLVSVETVPETELVPVLLTLSKVVASVMEVAATTAIAR